MVVLEAAHQEQTCMSSNGHTHALKLLNLTFRCIAKLSTQDAATAPHTAKLGRTGAVTDANHTLQGVVIVNRICICCLHLSTTLNSELWPLTRLIS